MSKVIPLQDGNKEPGPVQINVRNDMSELQQEMLENLIRFEERAWSPTNRGFITGWKGLDIALEGIQPGWHIIAGDSNVGKSSFITHLAWQILQNNPDAYVVDFTLDDPMHEKLARFVACIARIPINAIKLPRLYLDAGEEFLKRRENGIKTLASLVDRYKCYDINHGTDIDEIEKTILRHMVEIETSGSNKRLIVFIDNFHDITTTAKEAQGSDKNKYDYLAQRCSDMANSYDIPIITTAEFRKLNSNKRPTVDDIRESVKIKYEAKSILLAYNEVGIKGEGASVYWTRRGSDVKQPVFELKIGKNKYTSYKTRLFFEFWPELAYFELAPEEDARRYNNLIYSGGDK